MIDLGNEADELALSLSVGLVSVDEAIAWTDAAVASLDQPPYALIEASLSGRAPALEVAHLLRAIPGPREPGRAIHLALRRMAVAVRDGHLPPASAARHLQEMLLVGCDADADVERKMMWFEDAFALAADGIWGTLEEVTGELEAFLAPYLDEK